MNGRGTGSQPNIALAVTNSAVLIHAGRCSLAGWFQSNTGNALAVIRLFDAAAAADVTPGTTACVFGIAAAATSFSQGQFAIPVQFTKGLVVFAATDFVTANSTAPNATQNISFALSS